MESTFLRCPLCGGKTRAKLLPETVLKNYPLFCPKCKREIVISAEHGQIVAVRDINCTEEET